MANGTIAVLSYHSEAFIVDRTVTRLMIEVLTPPARAIGAVVRFVEWCFVGWWYEKRVRTKMQDELLQEIKDHFDFLFLQRNAHFVTSQDFGHFEDLVNSGWPLLTLETDKFRLRFFRWRDDYGILIAPRNSPHEWEEISNVLNAIAPEQVARHSLNSLYEAAKLLKQHLKTVENAISSEHHSQLKERMAQAEKYDRVVTRRFETEINRRIYG